MTPCRALLVLLLLVGPGAPACSAAEGSDEDELTVFAAASLTDAFEELGRRFEDTHAGVAVTFSFAGSQRLATQIVEGAPADVFASADRRQMDTVVEAGHVRGEPAVFAANELAIAVEPGNPAGVERLADLADPELDVVLGADEVPAGRYARRALDRAGVELSPVSLETDVRAVLSKVALGEADAGIVYTSDLAGRDDVTGVAVPPEVDVSASYPIAVVSSTALPELARAFVDHVLSPGGQAVLRDHGFRSP